MSAPVQPANSRTATDRPTPNTNKLCITLVADYSNGKIRKDDTIKHILEAFCKSDVHKSVTPVQVQTVISAYIGMLDQAKSAQEIAALQGRGGETRLKQYCTGKIKGKSRQCCSPTQRCWSSGLI